MNQQIHRLHRNRAKQYLVAHYIGTKNLKPDSDYDIKTVVTSHLYTTHAADESALV